METQKQKAVLIMIAAAIFVFIGIVVLFAILKESKQVNPFANCQVLSDSCKDKDCRYLFLCNVMEFSDCQVYDCGDSYGVLIEDKEGKINQRTVAKPDQTKVREMVSKCQGSFEVIEKNNCENGEARARVKINTKGDCKIVSATMAINGKNRIASVEQDGEFYNISVKSCGEISDIKITGEGGVGIREKIEIPEDALPKDVLPEDIMKERLSDEPKM